MLVELKKIILIDSARCHTNNKSKYFLNSIVLKFVVSNPYDFVTNPCKAVFACFKIKEFCSARIKSAKKHLIFNLSLIYVGENFIGLLK